MIYSKPTTPEWWKACGSETAKYRFLTEPYCYRPDGLPGCGVDIASQGDAVVPWAISFDLPVPEFNAYCGNHPAKGPICLRGHADVLPFDSKSLDWLYSSHLLEDYLRSAWPAILTEWTRVVKSGGHIIVLVPERSLWALAISRGQSPNCSHCGPEPLVGDLTVAGQAAGLTVLKDELTNQFPDDYSIIGVFQVP